MQVPDFLDEINPGWPAYACIWRNRTVLWNSRQIRPCLRKKIVQSRLHLDLAAHRMPYAPWSVAPYYLLLRRGHLHVISAGHFLRAVAPTLLSGLCGHPAPSAHGFTGSGQVEAERAI